MNKTELIRAFNGVDDELIERCEKAAAHKVIPLRRRVVMAVAAVMVVVVLMGAAVVKYSDSIQNYLKWTWNQYTNTEISTEQDAVIEHLSQEIGLSETIDGVTVTIDSALVGENMAYILLRIEGAKDFDLYGGSGIVCEGEHLDIGHTLSTHPGADDSVVVFIHKTFNTYGEPVDISEPFTVNLKMDGANVGVNGNWDFVFELEPNTVRKCSLPDTEVTVPENGFLRNYGYEQLNYPIGKFDTANEISITADSAEIKDGQLKLLVVVKGIDYIKDRGYSIWYDNITLNNGEDLYINSVYAEQLEYGAVVFTLYTDADKVDFDAPIVLKMFDFMSDETTGELLAEGEWEIEFNVERHQLESETAVETVLFKNLVLSETGLSGEYFSGSTISTDRTIYAIMESGEKAVLCRGLIWSDLAEEEVYHSFSLNFEVPVKLDEVTAIQIFDTVIPVK